MYNDLDLLIYEVRSEMGWHPKLSDFPKNLRCVKIFRGYTNLIFLGRAYNRSKICSIPTEC